MAYNTGSKVMSGSILKTFIKATHQAQGHKITWRSL
jgi:hypothetical protein